MWMKVILTACPAERWGIGGPPGVGAGEVGGSTGAGVSVEEDAGVSVGEGVSVSVGEMVSVCVGVGAACPAVGVEGATVSVTAVGMPHARSRSKATKRGRIRLKENISTSQLKHKGKQV
jgi:hypothetical protein